MQNTVEALECMKSWLKGGYYVLRPEVKGMAELNLRTQVTASAQKGWALIIRQHSTSVFICQCIGCLRHRVDCI